MADIDDELLALAGGSDEDDVSENDSREPSLSPEPQKKRATTGKPGSKKGPGKNARRRGRHDDSEEEEGEASSTPSTPNSSGSVPMDESDSDAEPQRLETREDIDEKYPVEGLYVSLAEKAEIMKMREVERETILADRREENQRFKQNRLLRQLVSAAEEKEKEQQKRKRSAEDADLEDGQRKPSRQRTRLDGTKVGETSSGIDTFRRARAEKSDRQRRREEDRERQKDKISPRKSARDQDADDDEDGRRSRTPENEGRDRREPDLGDFERLRISRGNFAEVCFKPSFEKIMTDCYVRVLGKPDRSGEQRYHVLSIKGFTTGRAYAMPDARGKQFVTDQHILCGLGKKVEPYPFVAMSNGRFTEDELRRHKEALQDMGLAIPKLSALNRKLDELRELVAYTPTNDEITAMVEKKNQLRKQYDPQTRENLDQAVREAREKGNLLLANQLQEELEALGKPAGLAFRTTLTPTKPSPAQNSTQQERLAELNRENRRRNIEAVRKAQLKERQRAREMEKKIARGEEVEEDFSRRLKTKAKFVYDVNESPARKSGSAAGSGASTPANGTPKLSAQKQPQLPHLARLHEQKYAENKGIPTIHKPLMDDDIIASLDLDIDVEID